MHRLQPLAALAAVGLLLALTGGEGTLGHAQEEMESSPADTGELRRRYAELLQKKFLLEREQQLKTMQITLAETDTPYLFIDMAEQSIG